MSSARRLFCWLMFPGLLGLGSRTVCAEPARPQPPVHEVFPDGIHVLDGSCYLNVGELHVNITNHGLIGSQYSNFLPFSGAPSAQWPGGSGDEYLWGAGLWVGGRIRGEVSVSTGQYEREFRPDCHLEDTIYEGKAGVVLRPSRSGLPTGRRLPDRDADDDGDGAYDEDPLNGRDDDGDGLIDEDWGQLGDQMFTCTMYDNLPLCRELYPAHRPLNLKVVQRAAAWRQEALERTVALDYEITNVGIETIKQAYVGFFVDCDIQARGTGGTQPDDLAGSWRGYVRGEDGRFHRVEVAWMRDLAPTGRLPGWFGVVLVYHTREFYGYHAPTTSRMTGFQIFATNAAVVQQGEPASDEDRYALMARQEFDRDRREDQYGDLKFMISSGPFPVIEPGQTVSYRLALVIGEGFEDLLAQAVQAAELGAGTFFDHDRNYLTGNAGRETEVCLGDIPSDGGKDPLFRHKIQAADMTCIGPDPVFLWYLVLPEDIREREDGRFCTWVNGDNCEECAALYGRECTIENDLFFGGDPYISGAMPLTGTGGRETRYAWSRWREYPPPSPSMRLMPGDRRVEVFWDDGPESAVDPDLGRADFESYRVWRVRDWIRPPGVDEATLPPSTEWGLIGEYDLVNDIPAGVGGVTHARPLGPNTGLDVARYVPSCLRDPAFDGLAERMQAVVDRDSAGSWTDRPSVRLPSGAVRPGMTGLVPWEMRPDVLDTFWGVAERVAGPDVVPKRPTRFYHHLDRDPPNGFPLYYGVVATDHRLEWNAATREYQVAGPGLSGNPWENARLTMPRPEPQSAERRRAEGPNIYVFPNPATREALAEFQQQHPTLDDPTGVRVMFANLPDSRNRVQIFTAAGDHIITLDHDPAVHGGSLSWNLMSRNGQEVVSGIYLFVVESENPAFDVFRGRFVVIR